MKSKVFTFVLAVITSAYALSALATPIETGGPEAGGGCSGLKIGTGPRDKATGKGKGYSRLYDDLADVCGKVVPLCEVRTSGGLENLNSLSTKEIDIGFAQLDTLKTMKNGDENIASLQAVAGLNFNYLHIVASRTGIQKTGGQSWKAKLSDKLGFGSNNTPVVIGKYSDLRNRPVAVVGSASLLLAQLNKLHGYNMIPIEVKTDEEAFAKVISGEAAAAMTVSSWPSGTVSAIDAKSDLTLIPFDVNISEPYLVRTVNYRNLGVYNNNMLAVPNLLVTRPFSEGGEKAAEVKKLQSCLSAKLGALKEGSYAPGWNEIKSLDNVFDVQKFGGKKK